MLYKIGEKQSSNISFCVSLKTHVPINTNSATNYYEPERYLNYFINSIVGGTT